MDDTKKHFFFLGIYAIIFYSLYVFKIGGDNYITIVQYAGYLTLLIALYFGYNSLKYFGIKSAQGKIVLTLMITLGSWLIGDVIWDLSGDAVVSVGDIFFFLGYGVIGVGLIKGINLVQPDFFKKKIIPILIFFAIATLLYIKFFPLSWNSEISLLENVATVGYLFAEVVLIMLVVTILVMLFTGSYSSFWLAVAGAIICAITSDIFYSLYFDVYESGSLIDLGWFTGYLLYALAFILLKHGAQKAMKNVSLHAESQKKVKA